MNESIAVRNSTRLCLCANNMLRCVEFIQHVLGKDGNKPAAFISAHRDIIASSES